MPQTIKPSTPLPWAVASVTKDGFRGISIRNDEHLHLANMVMSLREGERQDAAYIVAAANGYPKLVEALRKMLAAHAALMPGLRHISVQDYALQNEAPLEASRLLRSLREAE